MIAPTREIALQGVEVASQIGSSLPEVKISTFIGGMPLSEDRVKAQHCHMAVGTPGRLKQVLDEGILNADTVRLVIMDEADKLLEPSFITDTTHILNALPQNKQVLALSATYPAQLADLAEKFMRSPQHIRPGKESQVLHGTAQFVMELEASLSKPKQNQIKQNGLLKILSSVPYNQCLVFSNFQVIAQSSADFLNSRGFPSIFISAGQDQTRRIQAIQTFKTFKCRILCSTDLTARGIDAENVNLVINLDVPEDHNTYLHRIGRGGRYGSNSIAISLAPQGKELTRLKKIVTQTDSVIKVLPAILPKDIRQEDLPLLAGLSLEELEQRKANIVKEKKIKVSDTNDETADEKPQSKHSNKIKRRGKKKRNHSEESVLISSVPPEAQVVDYEETLKSLVSYKPNCFAEVESYQELCDIAKNESSSGLLLQDFKEASKSIHEKKAMGEHFLNLSKTNHELFDKELKIVEKDLGYRSLADILERVKVDTGPIKHVQSSSPLSCQSSSRSSESDSSDDENETSSADPSSISEDPYCSRAVPAGRSGDPVGRFGSSSNRSADLPGGADPAYASPQSGGLHGNYMNLAGGLTQQQVLQLQQWMANVERQRQIIQDKVYRETVDHYSNRS